MYVYINGTRVRVDETLSIGQGGEAELYRMRAATTCLKIYKPPGHPDFEGFPAQQQAARARIAEHQRKLPAFPRNLPARVIVPRDLARDDRGRIVGYTMRFLDNAEVLMRYSERGFRRSVPNDQVVKIFCGLHHTFCGVHLAGMVLGDANDLNDLVVPLTEVYLIDIDSAQFSAGGETFYCLLYTERFVDPLLCDPTANRPVLVRPHNEDSDWYAFRLKLMRSLLFVGPYGGIYKPKDKSRRIPRSRRPLKRVTVFDPEVGYPKNAIHFGVLPDDLLEHFEAVFVRDQRGKFPIRLLEELRWTRCTECGAEHARAKCPVCKRMPAAAITEVVRGDIVVKRIFRTAGAILHATVQEGKLLWLYHDGANYRREDGSVVMAGSLATNMRFRLFDDSTLIAKGGQLGGQLITLKGGQIVDRLPVDRLGNLPIFDTNATARYWVANGRLQRDDRFGSKYIGDVLRGQTLFWVGPKFGFGFYRAGRVCVYFVFDAESRGINDSVEIPHLRGQLVDSSCEFSSRYVWFFVAIEEVGKIIHRCYVVRPDGSIKAEAEAEAGDGSWLGERIRGDAATGGMLFAATDEGLVRVEPASDGTIAVTKRFPDTEPFVDTGCHLFATREGISVVRRGEIHLISLRKKN